MNNLHHRSVVVTTATNNKEWEPLLLRDVQRKLELCPLLLLRTLILEPVHAPDNLGVSHLKLFFFLSFYLLLYLFCHLQCEITVAVIGDSGAPSVRGIIRIVEV